MLSGVPEGWSPGLVKPWEGGVVGVAYRTTPRRLGKGGSALIVSNVISPAKVCFGLPTLKLSASFEYYHVCPITGTNSCVFFKVHSAYIFTLFVPNTRQGPFFTATGSAGGTSMVCRADIRTRACLTASQGTTVWATLVSIYRSWRKEVQQKITVKVSQRSHSLFFSIKLLRAPPPLARRCTAPTGPAFSSISQTRGCGQSSLKESVA